MEQKTQDSEWDLVALRRRSKLLLGSPHRLSVLALAASRPESELYAGRIAALAEMPRRDAARVLRDLRKASLLLPGGKIKSGQRGRPGDGFQRREDDAWKQFLALAAPAKKK